MATTLNSQHTVRPAFATRSSIQKVCIGMGVAFILVGFLGILMPGFMNMHLSLSHNLIHLASGAFAIGFGYSDNSRAAYHFAIAFGVVYGLLGIAGFVIGQPGYPGVGHMAADQNLLRVIPNVLEFGTMDHSVHILLSAAFLFSAYAWKHTYLEADRSLVDVQRRAERTVTSTETFDSASTPSDLKDSILGQSDISVIHDRDRRDNFEERL